MGSIRSCQWPKFLVSNNGDRRGQTCATSRKQTYIVDQVHLSVQRRIEVLHREDILASDGDFLALADTRLARHGFLATATEMRVITTVSRRRGGGK